MHPLSTTTAPSAGRRSLPLRLLAATLALSGVMLPALAADPNPAALEQALRQLLRSKPELVREALDTLQRREALAATQRSQKALADAGPALRSEVGSTVLGNPNGDVTLVEFSDYRCGYCKQVSASINALLRADPGLRVLVKHLPVLGNDSMEAAQWALSAGQGQPAQALHAALLAAPSLDADSLRMLAHPAGRPAITLDKAAANLALGEVRQLADRLGIQGTPALVIGDTLVRGAVDLAQLETMVRAARQARQSSGAAQAAKVPATAWMAKLADPLVGKR